MKRYVLLLNVLFFSLYAFGQQKRDSIQLKNSVPDAVVTSQDLVVRADTAIPYSLIVLSYAYQMPGGDMAKRFKNNSNLGAGFLRKTRHNIIVGADAHYIFGPKPKENTLNSGIQDENGEVIDQGGLIADIRMYERGYDASIKVGKVFPRKKLNPNSGWFAMLGVGYLQHKIRIEPLGNQTPQLSKEYREGYDRMTNGLMLSQTIGFMYLGKKRLTNLYLGIEVCEGLTQGRRYNFDTRTLDNAKRFDLLYGLRLGWLIPFSSSQPEESYFN